MPNKKREKRHIEKVHMNIPIIIGKGRISHKEFNHHSMIIEKCYLTEIEQKRSMKSQHSFVMNLVSANLYLFFIEELFIEK